MKIEILGTGCPKCEKLAQLTHQAAEELNLACELVKVTDINEILSSGVMITPALIVDGKILFSGRVPSLEELKKALGKG